jgi:riboflavin kinase/FMN adenylyltransferase
MVRRLLSEGCVERAAQCLGRHYSLSGKVVEGHQIGRRIGFPTANIQPSSPLKLIPQAGVYGVRCHLATDPGSVIGGMMNIGQRPTFGGTQQAIEVHLFDFQGDVYGQQLSVDFIFRQREERQFPSPEALEQQLRQDAAAISRHLLHNP